MTSHLVPWRPTCDHTFTTGRDDVPFVILTGPITEQEQMPEKRINNPHHALRSQEHRMEYAEFDDYGPVAVVHSKAASILRL